MIELLLILIVIGFALYLFNKFIEIDGKIKSIINSVIIFLIVMYVVLFLLDSFGIYNNPIKLK